MSRTYGRDASFPVPKSWLKRARLLNAILDGQWNFGQVGGRHAAATAIEKAMSTGVGCVVLRRCCHVGRLGAYVEMAARQNCVALACGGAAGEGHWVAPFGGREGRLGTNPIAFGAPTQSDPIVVDFATSSLPEGKVRFLRETGQMLPEMTLVNERGEYSTDPADLYAPDGTAAGAILPFGGPLGYKSYGISLMVQILSCMLGAPAWAEGNDYTGSNNLFILALRIESFMSPDEFRQQAEEMAAYVTGSKPAAGSTGVKLPGELEFATMEERRRRGIPLSPEVWSALAVFRGGVRRLRGGFGVLADPLRGHRQEIAALIDEQRQAADAFVSLVQQLFVFSLSLK